jgi:branched-chain amino acid transport system ATP-binding protein
MAGSSKSRGCADLVVRLPGCVQKGFYPMGNNNSGPLLQVRDVAKRFGGLDALTGVDLDVDSGRVVGLIGPNGSGKTTLFNIITGVYQPSSGRVLFAGTDITGFALHRTSRLGIARTFQQICLFDNMTVVENVIAGLIHRRSRSVADWLRGSLDHAHRADELLESVGLVGKEYILAGALPYGDQRRLEVARALATEPQLLLLDEPLAGMNPSEINEFLELLHRINRSGVTMLLIEHNVRAVMESCDPIYVFDYGSKIAQGSAEELLCDDAVIKAYLGEELAENTTAGLLGEDAVAGGREGDHAAG